MSFALTEVRPHNGAPALFLDGTPVFPLLLMASTPALAQLKEIAPHRIHLHTAEFPLGWTGIGRFNFSAFDEQMRELIRVDPAARVMPRIHLDPPDEWMDANPDELVGYADPAAWDGETCWGGAKHPSFASRKWMHDTGEALRRLLRHASEQEYSDRIFGWHIGSGVYGEWHAWNGVYYPDTSTPFVRAYEEWLRENFPGEEIEARLPSVEERMEGDCGLFRDPARRGWMLRHAEFFHQLGAQVLGEFARVVKQETGGRSLVLAFNGYLPELGVNHEIDHRAFETALRDDNIDAFAAPHSYARRKPGESGLPRGFTGSVRAAGKLWLDEADERTHLAHATQWKHVETREQGIETLWRSFAHALTSGNGLWFMDQGSLWFQQQTGSWYADAEILRSFAQMQHIGAEAMQRNRALASEVAVVMNFKAAFHLADRASGLDNISSTLTIAQTEQIALCGAPFDFYLLSELFEPAVPEYKAYIFLDAFALTDEELQSLCELRDAGKTLLFFYAAGLLSETELSLQRMQELLQMPVQQLESALLPDGSTQSPGFAVPELKNGVAQAGNVFFCPAPPLSATELRSILDHAGVHSYLDSDDTVMVGGDYVAVHAAENGLKTLRWPRPVTWKNERTGEVLASSASTLQTAMQRGQTLLLSVSDPKERC